MGRQTRDLRGAVVVLTGASSGIGRAAALAFAEKGASLVLCAREPSAIAEVAHECAALGARTLAVRMDVRSPAAVRAVRDGAVEHFGRIDVWVNDAGVYLLGGVEATPVEAVMDVFETNYLGVLYGTQAALGQFRAQSGGTLINVGSLAGNVPYAFASAYCGSKHAVHALTAALRQELVGTSIEACLVVPAAVDTPLFQHAANFAGRRIVALKPVISAAEVARAIVSCAERPRAEVRVGGAAHLATWAWRLVPRVLERVMGTAVGRQHFRADAPAEPSMGNVVSPLEPHAIEGGWRSRPDGAELEESIVIELREPRGLPSGAA